MVLDLRYWSRLEFMAKMIQKDEYKAWVLGMLWNPQGIPVINFFSNVDKFIMSLFPTCTRALMS